MSTSLSPNRGRWKKDRNDSPTIREVVLKSRARGRKSRRVRGTPLAIGEDKGLKGEGIAVRHVARAST